MIADRAVVRVGCPMQTQRSLIGSIASLAGVRVMMLAAPLGIRMRVPHVSMSMASMSRTDVHMALNMVSPQRHGTNTGDYQCYPASELS